MKRVDYNNHGSSSDGDESLSRYTPAQNSRIKRRLMEQSRSPQQNVNGSYSMPDNGQQQTNQLNGIKKKHHRHKIELTITIITALATIFAAGVTYLGYRQNQNKSQALKTEKIYHTKTAPKPKPRVKVKKVVKKQRPKKQNNIKRDQQIQQKAEQAQEKARQSAQLAKQRAEQARQSATVHKDSNVGHSLIGKSIQKAKNGSQQLKSKLQGYEQKPSQSSQNNNANSSK